MVFDKNFGSIDYSNRSKKAFLMALGASLLSLFLTSKSDLIYSILIAIFILVVFLYKGLNPIQFYINRLYIDQNICKISYQDKGVIKIIEGNTQDFVVTKCFLLVKGRTPVVKIINSSLNLKIKQHLVQSWRESDMNKLLSYWN